MEQVIPAQVVHILLVLHQPHVIRLFQVLIRVQDLLHQALHLAIALLGAPLLTVEVVIIREVIIALIVLVAALPIAEVVAAVVVHQEVHAVHLAAVVLRQEVARGVHPAAAVDVKFYFTNIH